MQKWPIKDILSYSDIITHNALLSGVKGHFRVREQKGQRKKGTKTVPSVNSKKLNLVFVWLKCISIKVENRDYVNILSTVTH